MRLLQSYRAYRKWVEVNGEEALLPGLNMTHEQVTIVIILTPSSCQRFTSFAKFSPPGEIMTVCFQMCLELGNVAILVLGSEINDVARSCSF